MKSACCDPVIYYKQYIFSLQPHSQYGAPNSLGFVERGESLFFCQRRTFGKHLGGGAGHGRDQPRV